MREGRSKFQESTIAMSQNFPFPPGGPNKPFPGKPGPSAGLDTGEGSSRACGCCALGCGGFLAVLVGLCGFGYYAFFYTVWPLQFAARQMEKSGVKVEGIRGNVTSGVEVDALEIPVEITTTNESSEGGATVVFKKKYQNQLRDLKLKYRGGGLFSSGMVVEEASIGSGVIYAPLSTSESTEANFFNGLSEFLDNFNREFTSTLGSSEEVRLDKLTVRDLKLIDPKTDFEYRIDEITYEGLNIIGGVLADIGDLRIKTDNLDLATTPGGVKGKTQRGRHLAGSMRPGSDPFVQAEIPFEIDYEFDSAGEFLYRGSIFDGQVLFSSEGRSQPTDVAFVGYEPDRFIRLQQPGVHPKKVTLRVKISKTITEVEPAGSFELGKTVFAAYQLGVDEKTRKNFVIARAALDDLPVSARAYISTRFPFISVHLASAQHTEDTESLRDLWSRVVYGSPFADLSDEERKQIDGSVERQLKKLDLIDESEQNKKSDLNKVGDEIRDKIRESLQDIPKQNGNGRDIPQEIRDRIEEKLKKLDSLPKN